MSLSLLAIFLFAGVCGALIASLAYERVEQRAAQKRLREEGVQRIARVSIIESALRPVFSLYAPLLKRLPFDRSRKSLNQKFVYAALTNYTPEEFWAFQILSSIMFVLFSYLVVFELRFLDVHSQIPWWLAGSIMLLGFLFPYMWLNSLIKTRRKNIVLEFPHFVANLTLTVEAGLDFIAAMTRIVRKMAITPLKEELERMLSEIQLGSTRAQALRNFSGRIGATEISTFTLVLIQADRLGTSIGKALRVQAERLRRERFEAAERKGALASQKLLFPLIFFIMPAVFVIIFGPLIVKLLTGGLKGLML
jgi:tight adherence protein C